MSSILKGIVDETGAQKLVRSADGLEKAFSFDDYVGQQKWKNSNQRKPEKPKYKAPTFAKTPKPIKPTDDQIYRKIFDIVGQSFPDGDPYDSMNPYMEKHGLSDKDLRRVLRADCGVNDLYELYTQIAKDTGYADPMNEEPTESPVGYQPGGNRIYRPKPAGQIETTPKKESSIMKGIIDEEISEADIYLNTSEMARKIGWNKVSEYVSGDPNSKYVIHNPITGKFHYSNVPHRK